jgi:outer membrane protein assembly factor BamB
VDDRYRVAVANGGGPCVRCYALLVGVIVVILATTGAWNPWPGLWNYINSSEPLSTTSAAWQQRLGGAAQSVTITGEAVVVEYRTSVEAFGVQAGVQLWEKNADWSAVAGGDSDSVVVVGEMLAKGYEVLDPVSGVVRRKDTEAAAVWTFDNAILDVRCDSARDCHLTAWEPRGAEPLWTVPTPGMGFVLFADNPDLPDTRPLSAPKIDDRAGGPVPVPAVIGFPADGRLHLIDTAGGSVVRVLQPDRTQRVTVVGGRALTVAARAADGTCYFTVTAIDPASGQPVWQREGLNLRTTDGAGCEHRNDPAGGKDVVLGVTPTGREALVDVHDGRSLWRGGREERVIAVDDRYAVIRSPDGRRFDIHDFGRGRTAWRHTTTPKAQAAVTPFAIVVVDESPRRIAALRPATGSALVETRSGARVLAVGSRGMVIGEGRDIAYLPFAGVPPPAGGGKGDDDPCPGPKGTPCVD